MTYLKHSYNINVQQDQVKNSHHRVDWKVGMNKDKRMRVVTRGHSPETIL